jgi:hypothetical protein
LVPRLFGVKTQFMAIGFPWISLDSLVRIETFQWVTRQKAWTFFPRGFSPEFAARKGTAVLARRSVELLMWLA